jgi:hypothetical protein
MNGQTRARAGRIYDARRDLRRGRGHVGAGLDVPREAEGIGAGEASAGPDAGRPGESPGECRRGSRRAPLEIVPFRREHLFQIELQGAQASLSEKQNLEYAVALEQSGAYTGLVDGRPIICAGLVEQWEGRALAWALLSNDAGPWMLDITRACKRMFQLSGYRRIEAHVDAEFQQAVRWALMLGFEVESKMQAFTPEGRDAFMFTRLR